MVSLIGGYRDALRLKPVSMCFNNYFNIGFTATCWQIWLACMRKAHVVYFKGLNCVWVVMGCNMCTILVCSPRWENSIWMWPVGIFFLDFRTCIILSGLMAGHYRYAVWCLLLSCPTNSNVSQHNWLNIALIIFFKILCTVFFKYLSFLV